MKFTIPGIVTVFHLIRDGTLLKIQETSFPPVFYSRPQASKQIVRDVIKKILINFSVCQITAICILG